MDYYAHTDPQAPGDPSKCEPLFTADCPALSERPCSDCESLDREHGHLNKVAYWTAKFAAEMFPTGSEESESARQWGYVAGLWHDLGKYAPEWQAYLRQKGGSNIHTDEVIGTVDHSTAGAQHAVQTYGVLGHLLAYAISGHHSGLLDAIADRACLEKRLKSTVFGIPGAPAILLGRAVPALPQAFAIATRAAIVPSMFVRMIFSALVDADFLATEAFMNPEQATSRRKADPTLLQQMADLLERHCEGFPAPTGKVAEARAGVRAACISTAAQAPGLFSLTVPTGGGKTLSSLAFALRHALAHGQRRVIYVIPFTSIIEQNAAVFEAIFRPLEEAGDGPVVVQHHSNFAPAVESAETTRSRLAAENWDAPLIVTTAVQFYESLHAARTSSCRKLHRIANSVVILDEAQCLPVQYMRPCLDALRELTSRYHATAVLCTATQPEIGRSDGFPVGLENVREIIPQPAELYQTLRRVKVSDRGALSDETLAAEISACEQVLIIVNTRGHAQKLFQRLPKGRGNFHLSALMCPAHRQRVLKVARFRLRQGKVVRLISTQLIEAGVDIDFPRVYRALAGIDSLAQAAGRCNREGRWAEGELHVFRSEHQRAERYFRETAQIAEQVLELHRDDALGLESVKRFFTLYYQGHRPPDGPRWDTKDITGSFKLAGSTPKLPFQFQYKEVAEKFRLIENEQVPVLIPFDDKARSLLATLCDESIPLHRALLRGLQRYTVQIYQPEFDRNRAQFESVRKGQFSILSCPEMNYKIALGLRLGQNDGELLLC